MKVQEIMTKDPAFCMPEDSVQSAAKMMCQCDCGEIPVLDGKDTKHPIGVITDRDITCRTVAEGKNPLTMRVTDCMSSPAVTVTLDTDVDECCELLERHQIRRIPVVDRSGRCCGIVAQADIARKCGPAKAGEVVQRVSLAAA